MNIINHLTKEVTPKIIKGNSDSEKIALLEKFYSIVLIRLSHEDSYKKLISASNTRKGKKKGKVIYADFFYKLPWVKIEETPESKNNPQKTIANQLAENHDIAVSDIKKMFRDAMPIVVSEIQKLSADKNVSEFLQELLANSHTDKDYTLPIIDYVPQWGISMFPAGIIPDNIEHTHKGDKKKTNNNIVKDSSVPKSNNDKQPKSNKKNDIKKLPEPVHVLPSQDKVEPNISAEAKDTHTSNSAHEVNNNSSFKKFLPYVGGTVMILLILGLAKGCQNTQESRTEIAAEKVLAVNPVADDNEYMPAVLKVEVDKKGNLQSSKLVSGSEKLDNQVQSALIDTFGEISEHSDFTFNKSMRDEMPVSERLNDLLILVKGVPESSMVIIGNDISFVAPDKASQEKLVSSAQALLPSFKVSSEVSEPALVVLEVVEDEQKIVLEVVEDEPKIVEIEAVKSQDSSVVKNLETTEITEPTNTPTVLDRDAKISKSIEASNQALDKLLKQGDFTPQELSTALNLQIINFSTNQVKIPEDNQKILDKAFKLLKILPNSRVRIIGYTDSAGDDDYNQRLSNDRAYAVKKFFIKKGMKSIHMKEIGMGEEKPIASNDTDEGRFSNRRIEFIVKQGTPEPTDNKKSSAE